MMDVVEIASHTPKKLQYTALEEVVNIIIRGVFPSSVTLLWLDGYPFPRTHAESRKNDVRLLDTILMCTEAREPALVPYKTALLERLQHITNWLNENEALGSAGSYLRKQIRDAMTQKLELIDPLSYIPLFKYLLELLFASKVGGCSDAAQFPFIPKVNCELWRKDCPQFIRILKSFSPFQVEELSTRNIKFGYSEVLIVVIENSPFLKRVHLHHNVCEDVLIALRENCPLLETFQMQQCMGAVLVSIEVLYRSFFRGMNYESVMAFANNKSQSERQKQLTFQHLNCVNFGKMDDLYKAKKDSLSLFIFALLHFYSHTMNVICGPLLNFSPALPSALPECLSNTLYNVTSCCLNGIYFWSLSHSASENDLEIPFKHVKQASLSTRSNSLMQSFFTNGEETCNHPVAVDLINFSKKILPRLKCQNFLLYIIEPLLLRISLEPLFKPLFSDIGCTLTSFQLYVQGTVNLSSLCAILSLCPHLEMLRIKLHAVQVSESVLKFDKQLQRLTSFTIYSMIRNASHVHRFIEVLLNNSPELYSLSMVLRDQPCEWLMSIASSKMLNRIRILRLSFHNFNFTLQDVANFGDNVSISFYVNLIELLTNLKVLQLGSIPHPIFMQMKQIYTKSDLQLDVWYVPRDSMEWYGGI